MGGPDKAVNAHRGGTTSFCLRRGPCSRTSWPYLIEGKISAGDERSSIEQLQQSQNVAQLNSASYIYTLARQLHHSHGVEAHRVRLTTHVEDIWLSPEKTIRCSLILNELLSNVLKYAFPVDQQRDITIELHAQPEQQATLVVRCPGSAFLRKSTFDIANR
jgi:two-component sensor histidine kinase